MPFISIDVSSLAGVDVTCSHPVVVKNLCSHCGEAVKESELSVAFEYIRKVYILLLQQIYN
jgi:non-homologous end joining protein Ku